MNRLLCLSLLIGALHARADYVFVNQMEAINTLYVNAAPHTIQVLDGYVVTDTAHQRQIPILIRYPVELVNAPGAPLPVVLWSHGGGPDIDGRLSSREWSEALVRAGYVVIHMSHVARTAAELGALYSEFGLTAASGPACFNSLQVDRPRDGEATLNALPQITANFPILKGRLDSARIAIAGHSFGAYTVRTLAGATVDLCPPPAVSPNNFAHHNVSFRDPRPRAFLALSPQGPGRFGFFETLNSHSWIGLNRPDLTASGAGDDTGPGGEQPVDRIRPFQLMPTNDKYQLYINSLDAFHSTFNLNNPAQPQMQAVIRASGLAFLDAHLQGNARAAAWLHAPVVSDLSAGVAVITRR